MGHFSVHLEVERMTTVTAPYTQRHRSIFELPADFFDSCRLLRTPFASPLPIAQEEFASEEPAVETSSISNALRRWSCNTCKSEFESLQDQRSHFKSDIHRLNIKLSIAGKSVMREEDFDDGTPDLVCRDYDISSISASDDEDDRETVLHNEFYPGLPGIVKNKLFMKLQTGEVVSLWKSLLLKDSDHILFENVKPFSTNENDTTTALYLSEKEVFEKLKYSMHKSRDDAPLRIVLLARGGHFAGCVFDGNSVLAHKTFHRYVIRAKAGKKQSSKDASGKIAHSAGASLRRHNELALKREIQELLAAWKPYFAKSSCVFVHAPSDNRQLFFDGNTPYFSCQHSAIRNIPLTVRRPTFKEARRIYNLLTQISFEANEEEAYKDAEEGHPELTKEAGQMSESREIIDQPVNTGTKLDETNLSSESGGESENDIKGGVTTPLHEAAKSGNANEVLELLEQGMDPCVKNERGRTPYMVATVKEVRNTFRRFMASNPDKWDWNAARVPSALTKELEESQAAKQAEKDAKKKARAKEHKKLRKARQKKAQAEANEARASDNVPSEPSQSSLPTKLSKEEELKRAQDAEREKRAAAAERRMAAAAAANVRSQSTVGTDILCSCCNVSLAGKVPFHRYNYKYCSTSCMHVHRDILEDG